MNIKLAILNYLVACGAWASTKPLLKTAVQSSLGGRIGDGEFDDALRQLKEKGLVSTRTDDLTGDTRYFITETGKTRVAQ